MDEFVTTVKELRTYLEDKPDDASVVITPPVGESFPLLGWAFSEPSHVVVLTGAEGAYDTATGPEVVWIATYVDENGEQQAQAYVSDEAAWRDINSGAFGQNADDGPVVVRSTVQP